MMKALKIKRSGIVVSLALICASVFGRVSYAQSSVAYPQPLTIFSIQPYQPGWPAPATQDYFALVTLATTPNGDEVAPFYGLDSQPPGALSIIEFDRQLLENDYFSPTYTGITPNALMGTTFCLVNTGYDHGTLITLKLGNSQFGYYIECLDSLGYLLGYNTTIFKWLIITYPNVMFYSLQQVYP